MEKRSLARLMPLAAGVLLVPAVLLLVIQHNGTRPPRSTEELMRQVRARRVAHPGDGQGQGMYMCIRLLWTDGVA
jgi:hypothetical protein